MNNPYRVFASELVPGEDYHIIINLDLDNSPIMTNSFDGTFVRKYKTTIPNYAMLRYDDENYDENYNDIDDDDLTIDVAEFKDKKNGYKRSINLYNKFYRLPSSMDKKLRTQIERNVLMPSNSKKTEVLINSVSRQQTNVRPYLSDDLIKNINKFGGYYSKKSKIKKSRNGRKSLKNGKNLKSKKNMKTRKNKRNRKI
jgi:hypothetical protein